LKVWPSETNPGGAYVGGITRRASGVHVRAGHRWVAQINLASPGEIDIVEVIEVNAMSAAITYF
jgi:hypothetical protein